MNPRRFKFLTKQCPGIVLVLGLASIFASSYVVSAATNYTYHLPFAWGAVTNADAYVVIGRSNNVEALRKWTSATAITVSNLPGTLNGWKFTCVSSNSDGISDESNCAILRLITLMERDSIDSPLRPFTTPVFEPTNSGRLFWPSNWDARSLLTRDQ